MQFRRWLVFVCVALAWQGEVARAADRVALVVANSHYAKAPELRTPQADAQIVAQALRDAGFDEVTVVSDLGKAQFEQSLYRFSEQAENAEVALFYYAGHGVELNGQNYLVPTDSYIQREAEADLKAISLASVRRLMETARLKLIVLDACRDNPFPRMQFSNATRAVGGGGLRRIEPVDGEAVLYSTREGTTASDGAGKYSPFARAFAGRIAEPDIEIGIMFRKVRDDVRREVPDQEPFAYSSLSGDPFYFVRSDARSPVSKGTVSPGRARPVEIAAALPQQPASPVQNPAPMNRAMAGNAAGLNSGSPPTRFLSAVTLPQLGLTVRPAADGSAFAVDAVSSSGVSAGQVLAGDLIVGINSAPPVAGKAPSEQLSDPLAAQGRLRLLIKRGSASTVVILRQ